MKPVLVVGAATLDTKVHAEGDGGHGTCLSGRQTVCPGGTARNVAEVLARLDVPTMLLSAVGSDAAATQLVARSAVSGLNLSRVITVEGGRTASLVVVLDRSLQVLVAVSDKACLEVLDKDRIERHAEQVGESELVVADTSLSRDALDALAYACRRHGVPMALVPESPGHLTRLRGLLGGLFLLAPNAEEARTLTGAPIVTAADLKDAAAQIQGMGPRMVLLAGGPLGIVYRTAKDEVVLPAPTVRVIDPMGAGDALVGGFLFGWLRKLALLKALEIGQLAAGLTLGTPTNVHPKLSLDYIHANVV